MEFQITFSVKSLFHFGSFFYPKWINLKFDLGERNMNKRSCRDKDKIFFVTKSKIHFSLI